MTGFADLAGGTDGFTWVWEARSVNGRGLDLRLRLPEGLEALDAPLRAAAGRRCWRAARSPFRSASAAAAPAVSRASIPTRSARAVAGALAAAEVAAAAGLDLAPMTAADLLAVRGVVEIDSGGADDQAERPRRRSPPAASRSSRASPPPAAPRAPPSRRCSPRRSTGSRRWPRAARETAEARAARSAELLRARVEAVLATTAAVDEARLAQELALLAVRADVTEELDRLGAHVAAARGLLAAEGPVGRKLDFLMQEFNREANTLCSKSGSTELTAIGLELKVVIDQMREQVQNVE